MLSLPCASSDRAQATSPAQTTTASMIAIPQPTGAFRSPGRHSPEVLSDAR